MAITIVEFLAGTGQTLTLKLMALGSDVVANGVGDVATEATNRKRLYLATVDDALAGVYHAHVFDAESNIVLAGYITLVDDTNTYRIESSYSAAISTANTLNDIADAILKRDMSAVTGESARSLLNALRFLRNKWAISGTTLTVYEEDDITPAWTSALTTLAGTNPIVTSDPT